MDARDDAVRAVSLPENRKEISRHSTTARMITRSTVVMVQGLPWDGGLYPDHPNRAQILKSRRSNLSALLRQKSTNLGSIDVICHEGFADSARENECEPAAFDLLVLGDEPHERIRVRH